MSEAPKLVGTIVYPATPSPTTTPVDYLLAIPSKNVGLFLWSGTEITDLYIEVKGPPGSYTVSTIHRGSNPLGSGGQMIKYGLDQLGAKNPTQIIVDPIINGPTIADMKVKDAHPANSRLGKTVVDAVNRLGGTITKWTVTFNPKGEISAFSVDIEYKPGSTQPALFPRCLSEAPKSLDMKQVQGGDKLKEGDHFAIIRGNGKYDFYKVEKGEGVRVLANTSAVGKSVQRLALIGDYGNPSAPPTTPPTPPPINPINQSLGFPAGKIVCVDPKKINLNYLNSNPINLGSLGKLLPFKPDASDRILLLKYNNQYYVYADGHHRMYFLKEILPGNTKMNVEIVDFKNLDAVAQKFAKESIIDASSSKAHTEGVLPPSIKNIISPPKPPTPPGPPPTPPGPPPAPPGDLGAGGAGGPADPAQYAKNKKIIDAILSHVHGTPPPLGTKMREEWDKSWAIILKPGSAENMSWRALQKELAKTIEVPLIEKGVPVIGADGKPVMVTKPLIDPKIVDYMNKGRNPAKPPDNELI